MLLDTAGFRDRIEKRDFQAYTVLSAVRFDEPDLYYARLTCRSPSNLAQDCNPDIDKLFAEQRSTSSTRWEVILSLNMRE
jgi:hypothetical protein